MREKYPNLRHYAKWQDFARLMFLRGSPLLKQYAVREGEREEEGRRGGEYTKALTACMYGVEVDSRAVHGEGGWRGG